MYFLKAKSFSLFFKENISHFVLKLYRMSQNLSNFLSICIFKVSIMFKALLRIVVIFETIKKRFDQTKYTFENVFVNLLYNVGLNLF